MDTNDLKYYKIPGNLQGKTILDVGTSDGYFASELYKRGAEKVVAIDFNTGPFHQAVNELMGTNVEFIPKDLFDLNESFGKFDIVLCSHVLQHVSDLFTAIRKLKSVTREMAIITTAYLDNFPQFEDFPILYFIGDEKRGSYGGTYWTFHRANRKCLRKMMEVAKFKKVEENINLSSCK
ncbi:MAG: class I SAM-dependent methyltransferase [Nitrospirota bacterium]